MDEPGLPAEYGRTLLTCEWGRGGVFRHPLTAKSATFTAEEKEFIKLPRPTDIDYDASGSFYVASWRDGGFSFSHPFVGFVVKVSKDDLKPTPLPDYKKLTIKELVAQLRLDSLKHRQYAQLELRRRMFPDAVAKLVGDPKKPDAAMPAPGMMMSPSEKTEALGLLTDLLFDAKQPLESRIAAIPLINESHRDANEQEAQDFVARLQNEVLAGHDPLTPWISWLLTPLPISQTSNTGILFKSLLAEDDPRARLQAVELAARLPFTPLLRRVLLNRLADEDPAVAHRVERAFLQLAGQRDGVSGNEHALNQTANNPDFLRGLIATLSTGTLSENERVASASARILGQMHSPEVVAELCSNLKSSTLKPSQRRNLLTALCREYFQDAKWDGKWWGTRPDTSGPYYTPETWSETPKVTDELKKQLAASDAETKAFLIRQLLRHKIDLPEAAAMLPELAKHDAAFRADLVPVLNVKKTLSVDEISILDATVRDDAAEPETRGRAIQALCRFNYDTPAFETGFAALIAIHGEKGWPPQIRYQADQLARDGRNKNSVEQLVKRLDGAKSLARELTLAMMLDAANDKNMKTDKRDKLNKAFTAAWADAAASVDLLHAIVRTKSDDFDDEVAARTTSADKAIKTAAIETSKKLGLDKKPKSTGPKIAALAFDDIVVAAKATKGDVAQGERLFTKAQCVNCHTVNKSDTPKGPFLGGIALRYSRNELSESILKPSAKIAQGFETQWFQTDDGLTHEGFVARESGTEVELRNNQGNVVTLNKEHIEERGKREESIMPKGLLDQLTTDDLASLLAYLESLKAQ
ncbi:MAG: c-type cytochrome [Pirellulales bacterium]